MFLCVLSPLNPCVSPPVYSHVCPSARSLIAHLFSFACLSLRPPALPSSGLPFFRQPVWRLFFICSVLWSVIAVLAGGEASMDCEGNYGRRSRTCGRVFARLMSLQCLLLSGGECPQRTRVSLFRTDGRADGQRDGRMPTGDQTKPETGLKVSPHPVTLRKSLWVIALAASRSEHDRWRQNSL